MFLERQNHSRIYKDLTEYLSEANFKSQTKINDRHVCSFPQAFRDQCKRKFDIIKKDELDLKSIDIDLFNFTSKQTSIKKVE